MSPPKLLHHPTDFFIKPDGKLKDTLVVCWNGLGLPSSQPIIINNNNKL
jgi:hypothetical protein